MKTWIYYQRRECPICNGTRKDCRKNGTTNFIHCRDESANPIDYIFRGLDALGFGMWAYQPDVQAWKDERREEWQRKKQLEREINRKKAQITRKESLSLDERDRGYREIFQQLTLSERHRQNLRNRGFSDSQIERGLFRTAQKWQKLEQKVNNRLPGVGIDGHNLITPGNGILCPIMNHKGQIIAYQQRLDDSDNGAKYLWCASERKRNPRPSAHLSQFNSELPLSYFKGIEEEENLLQNTSEMPYLKLPQDITKAVGLTEGTHIKPYMASIKTGLTVIGAAGGNFASSPQQLQLYLEHEQPQIVILFPDAGAILNQNVLRQYKKTFHLLETLGYPVVIAWWGQREKEAGDIDEIEREQLQNVTYLNKNQFLAIALENQAAKNTPASERDFTQTLALVQNALQHIPADCPYHEWVTVLMAIHSIHPSLEYLAEQWSNRGSKYQSWQLQRKWRSFKDHMLAPCTIATLFSIAQKYHWKFPKGTGKRKIREYNERALKESLMVYDTLNQSLKADREQAEYEACLKYLDNENKAKNWFTKLIQPLVKQLKDNEQEYQSPKERIIKFSSEDIDSEGCLPVTRKDLDQGTIFEFDDQETERALIKTAYQMGLKVSINISPTGTGKTYFVGQNKEFLYHLSTEEHLMASIKTRWAEALSRGFELREKAQLALEIANNYQEGLIISFREYQEAFAKFTPLSSQDRQVLLIYQAEIDRIKTDRQLTAIREDLAHQYRSISNQLRFLAAKAELGEAVSFNWDVHLISPSVDALGVISYRLVPNLKFLVEYEALFSHNQPESNDYSQTAPTHTLYYLDPHHTNVSDENIYDGFFNLYPRHEGMVYEPAKTNGKGQPWQVTKTKENQHLELAKPANCDFTSVHRKMAEKGHSNGSLATCLSCPSFNSCTHTTSADYPGQGFRNDSRETLKHRFVRNHLLQLRELGNYDIAIMEEIDRQLDITQTLKSKTDDFNKTYRNLRKIISKSKLKLLEQKIHCGNVAAKISAIDAEIEQLEVIEKSLFNLLDTLGCLFDHDNPLSEGANQPKYGFDDPDLRRIIKQSGIDNNREVILKWLDNFDDVDTVVAELIQEYQPLFQEYGFSFTVLSDLLKTPSGLDQSQSEKLHHLKKLFGVKLREKLSELPSNWLKHLLLVYFAQERGYLRFKKGLILTFQNNYVADNLKKLRFIHGLTATPDLESITAQLEIKPGQILLYRRANCQFNNVQVKIWTDCKGTSSNQWSEQSTNRMTAAAMSLLDLHQEVNKRGQKNFAGFTLKKVSPILQADTHFFSGVDRGSNQFEGVNHFGIFGLPQEEIGSNKAKFRTIYGYPDAFVVLMQLLKNSGDLVLLYQLLINSSSLIPMFFELYYQMKIYGAITQIMGRNRALRYLEEEFTVDIFCKDLDTGFLREAGYVNIQKKNIMEFGLDGVLSPHQQKIKAFSLFLEGRFKARESLGKLSEVASLLGMAKGTLSKLISEVLALDWQSLSGRFQNLLNLFKENGNSQKVIEDEIKQDLITTFTQTPEEIVWWFEEFFQSKNQTEAIFQLELALQLGVETFGVEVAMTMLGALSNVIFTDYDAIFPDFKPETG